MRTPILAGNWKMNLLSREIDALLEELRTAVAGIEDREVLVCPAFPYLTRAVRALENSTIRVGAQDCCWATGGAFTGEVSPEMLKDAGCTRVILGHSERRQLLGESDERINEKVRCAIGAGLDPIVCVGETLEERQADRTWEVIERQLDRGLQGLEPDDCAGLVIAYEPVWAIGTGQTASPEQAQEVHGQIRSWLEQRFGPSVSEGIRILYGGSVNPKNVDALMARPDVDGGLVGGASLRAADFARIVRFEA
jgi:triosephosphate isomerase